MTTKVTGYMLETGSVTSDKLAANSVTGSNLTFTGQAQGDLLYYNGSTWTRLGAGTSGQVLRTLGTGANPAWGSPMTLLGTLTTTSGTAHNVVSIANTYRSLYVEVDGVSFNAGTVALALSVTTNNGTNWGTGVAISNTLVAAGDTFTGTIDLMGIQISRGTTTNGIIARPLITTNTLSFSTAVTVFPSTSSGTINGIRFTGGTFDAGTIRVYGVP